MSDCGYKRLWQEVLVRAVQDAQGIGLSGGQATAAEIRAGQKDAQDWFGTPHFEVVCLRAGMDPDFINDAYKAGKLNKPLTDHGARFREEREEV